jgi:hypothetical protein
MKMKAYKHTHRLTKEEAMHCAIQLETQMQKKILSLGSLLEADWNTQCKYLMHLSYAAMPTLEALYTRPPYPEGEYTKHHWTVVHFYDRTVCGEPYYTVGVGNFDQEQIDELFSDEAVNSLVVEPPVFEWYWGCYMTVLSKKWCESQDDYNREESEANEEDRCDPHTVEERYNLE